MHQSGTNGSVVRLARSSGPSPEPTRIAARNSARTRVEKVSRSNIGAFSVTTKPYTPTRNRIVEVSVRPDMKGVRRIIDAIALGEDVRLAAQRPSSLFSRVCAFALLPLLLISPLAAAASEDVPLSAQVTAVVSSVVTGSISVPDTPSSAPATTPADIPANSVADGAVSPQVNTPVVVDPGVETPPAVATPTSSNSNAPTDTPVVSSSTPLLADTPAPAAVDSAPTTTTASSSPQKTKDDTPAAPPASTSTVSLSSNTTEESSTTPDLKNIPPTPSVSQENQKVAQVDTVTEENTATTSLLDAASPEQQQNMDDIRSQLRAELRGEVEKQVHEEMKDSVRDEVRMELQRSVEKKMMEKCTRVPDGSGVYCVSNMDVFGTKTESNDIVSVTSAPNPIDHNKEIYLTRGATTWSLTNNPDDDTNPSLDPVSDILVWQAIQNGRAQVAWTNVHDPKPLVHTLTNGENNFYPKVYAGRVAWQAWVDGNWEIVWAQRATTPVADEELSPENKALGISGDWVVHRVTHNNSPDMFPTLTRDGITWQAVDGGVWQVFTYDFGSGKTIRVSRPGVSSETPSTALVWTERNGTEERLVGRSLNDSESIDFTDAARRVGNHDAPAPKMPVNDTQMIVAAGTVKVEESASSTAVQ